MNGVRGRCGNSCECGVVMHSISGELRVAVEVLAARCSVSSLKNHGGELVILECDHPVRIEEVCELRLLQEAK